MERSEIQQRLAELEREWTDLRLYFLPYDRYVRHRMNVNGHCLDYVLESLTIADVD